MNHLSKKLYKEIDGELKLYTFDEGIEIHGEKTAQHYAGGVICLMVCIFTSYYFFIDHADWPVGLISAVTGFLSAFIFCVTFGLELNAVDHTYTNKTYFLVYLISESRKTFSEPVLRIYDSSVQEIEGFAKTDEGVVSYQLHLMTDKGFKTVFVFDSAGSAYGFKSELIKLKTGFRIW